MTNGNNKQHFTNGSETIDGNVHGSSKPVTPDESGANALSVIGSNMKLNSTHGSKPRVSHVVLARSNDEVTGHVSSCDEEDHGNVEDAKLRRKQETAAKDGRASNSVFLSPTVQPIPQPPQLLRFQSLQADQVYTHGTEYKDASHRSSLTNSYFDSDISKRPSFSNRAVHLANRRISWVKPMNISDLVAARGSTDSSQRRYNPDLSRLTVNDAEQHSQHRRTSSIRIQPGRFATRRPSSFLYKDSYDQTSSLLQDAQLKLASGANWSGSPAQGTTTPQSVHVGFESGSPQFVRTHASSFSSQKHEESHFAEQRYYKSLSVETEAEPIITPFVQILAYLNQIDEFLETLEKSQCHPNDAELRAMNARADLKWVLSQLHQLEPSKSVAEMTSNKYRQIMLEDMAKTNGGHGLMSKFLAANYFDDNNEELELIETQSTRSRRSTYASERPSLMSSQLLHTRRQSMYNPKVSVKGDLLIKDELFFHKYHDEFGIDPTDTGDELRHALSNIDDWDGLDFTTLDDLCNRKPLTCVGWTIFNKLDIFDHFSFDKQQMLTLLLHIESHYNSETSYHNAIHAADVTHSTYCLISEPILDDILTPLEKFAAVFSAIIHDVAHTGYNNTFLENITHDLAIQFNDQSIQENHHLSTAFKLITSDRMDTIIKTLISMKDADGGDNGSQWYMFRKLVIDMVLATDMKKHMEHMSNLKTLTELKKITTNELMLERVHDRLLLLKNVLHCADLGNPTKKTESYITWAKAITEEFWKQGDQEAEKSLPVSPLCDRERDADLPGSQIGFIDYVVLPYWETFTSLIPGDFSDRIIRQIQTNRQHFVDAKAAGNEVQARKSMRANNPMQTNLSEVHEEEEPSRQSESSDKKHRV